MYRTVNDFLTDWTHSAEGTLRVFESLSDDRIKRSCKDIVLLGGLAGILRQLLYSL